MHGGLVEDVAHGRGRRPRWRLVAGRERGDAAVQRFVGERRGRGGLVSGGGDADAAAGVGAAVMAKEASRGRGERATCGH